MANKVMRLTLPTKLIYSSNWYFMNSNNLFELIHQGFRVTVGATASLLETIQDPQKRETTLSELQTEFNQRTQEWAEKGESTEKEARRVIDDILNKQRGQKGSGETVSNSEPASNSTTTTNANVQSELKELTEQIVALKTELEQLRQPEG
ncbi:MAG: hypothetical protein AB4426_30135 [Xenococcaceae cyanobacterium]